MDWTTETCLKKLFKIQEECDLKVIFICKVDSNLRVGEGIRFTSVQTQPNDFVALVEMIRKPDITQIILFQNK